jgi:hypothetical protein
MLNEDAVLYTQNVGGNPIHGETIPLKRP